MCVFINIFKTEIIILNWNKNRDDYIRNVDCKHKNPTVYESITTTLIWEIQHRIGFRVIPPPSRENSNHWRSQGDKTEDFKGYVTGLNVELLM